MKNYLQNKCLLPKFKTSVIKGFTLFDMVAYIFMIVIFFMAMKIFLNPSPTNSSAEYRSRATLVIHLK